MEASQPTFVWALEHDSSGHSTGFNCLLVKKIPRAGGDSQDLKSETVEFRELGGFKWLAQRRVVNGQEL
jgi:hypothetical protein